MRNVKLLDAAVIEGPLCARSGHSKENAVDAFLNR